MRLLTGMRGYIYIIIYIYICLPQKRGDLFGRKKSWLLIRGKLFWINKTVLPASKLPTSTEITSGRPSGSSSVCRPDVPWLRKAKLEPHACAKRKLTKENPIWKPKQRKRTKNFYKVVVSLCKQDANRCKYTQSSSPHPSDQDQCQPDKWNKPLVLKCVRIFLMTFVKHISDQETEIRHMKSNPSPRGNLCHTHANSFPKLSLAER